MERIAMVISSVLALVCFTGCGEPPKFAPVDSGVSACSTDDECPEGMYCDSGVCVPYAGHEMREETDPGVFLPVVHNDFERLTNDTDHDSWECQPGDSHPCGSSEGECQPGEQYCTQQGEWGDCIGSLDPSLEVCDGLDNDCDGETDEHAVPEDCDDGFDNDCDGLIDDQDPDCTCVPDWDCNSWSSCGCDNRKYRNCHDDNECNTDEGRPDESHSCNHCGNGSCDCGEETDGTCPEDCGGGTSSDCCEQEGVCWPPIECNPNNPAVALCPDGVTRKICRCIGANGTISVWDPSYCP